MNDTLIIKTISKTYFVILSIFTFILLSFGAIFIILQNGLYLDTLNIQNIHAKELYIKWNEKLDVSIKKITLSPHKNAKPFKMDLQLFQSSVKKLLLTNTVLHTLTIESFESADTHASVFYKEGEEGYLQLSSQTFDLNSSLKITQNYLQLHIKNARIHGKKIAFQGNIYLHKDDFKMYSKIAMQVQKDISLTTFAILNNTHLNYRIKNHKKIKSIDYLVNTLHPPKAVKYWLLDAINMDYLSIKNAYGSLDINHLENALRNFRVDATLHKLNYKYNQKLDAIHTQQTQLQFKKGVLYIRPQQAYSYGMYLDKSWLKIDFTKKEELLTLHLLFDDGMLNKDVLNILNTYKIKLPFLQHTGKVTTKLKITVGLRNIDVSAKGSFYTQNANFDYLGLNIDVHKALIKLNNYDVHIRDMLASYKDIADAKVNVVYNAKKSAGTIAFDFSKIEIPEKKTKLFKKPLHILYTIAPQNDTILVNKSSWLINNKKVMLNALEFPFNLNTLMLHLPTTYFESPSLTNGYIDGTIDLRKQTASFDVDILSFQYNHLLLKNSNTHFKLNYNKKLTLSSDNKLRFDFNGTQIQLAHFFLESTSQILQFHKLNINIDNMLYTQLDFNYNIESSINPIHLNYLNIIDKNLSIYKQNNIDLQLQTTPSLLTLSTSTFDTKLLIRDNSWKLKVKSLSKLVKNSPLLQKLKITQGKVSIANKEKDKTIYVNAILDYPYPFLILHHQNIKKYFIKATINDKESNITVNDTMKIDIDDTVNITMKNCMLDLQELLKIKENVQLPQTKSKQKTIFLDTENVALQLTPTRKILSDTIALQSDSNNTTIQLKHDKGVAGFQIKNDIFYLYGKNFNDTFMEHLFSLSQFQGGSLEFSMKGSLDDFNGALYIHDTTVVDYKLLNNILAFINTVPSLLTFSLPDYNEHGLKVQTAYAKFNAKDGFFTISDFSLDSKELDILGKGTADWGKDTIDMTLNLKTDLGSNVSKIPLVGYILFDKDSISTSMKITGKLSNPIIHSLLARDIAVAPFNILKRTILLPFTIISDIVTPDKKEKK